jgi:hypothetical protein
MRKIDTTTIAAVADMIRDMLGDDFDDATFFDSLDGETDAGDILDRLIWNTQSDLHLIDAIKEHEAALKARRGRMEARVDANKAAMLSVMDAAGVAKAERPCATLTRRNGSASVHITDEDAVPTQLCQVKRVPDKKAIKAQIDAGEDVPGAEIRIGSAGVTMRSA